MKQIYFLFCLLSTILVKAQIINFPDANFKARLLQIEFPLLDANGDGEIEASEATVISFLDLSNANISDLTGINYFTNLYSLDCSYNSLTDITIDDSIQLEYLVAHHNALTSVNVNYANPAYSIDLRYNNLTSYVIENVFAYDGFDISHNQLTNLTIIDSGFREFNLEYNNLSAVQFVGNVHFGDANFRNNQFTILDLSGASFDNTFTVSLGNNVEDRVVFPLGNHPGILYSSINTFLDLGNYHGISNCGPASGESCEGITITNCPNLAGVNLKNGFNHTYYNWFDEDTGESAENLLLLDLSISNCPNLSYICTDEVEQPVIQLIVNNLGLANQVQVNSYCTFEPGGTFYTVNGNAKFNIAANSCDASDFSIPNQKFTITNETVTSTIIANDIGNYAINVGAGTHTITPIIENQGAFSVSPSNVVVDFPTQSSPLIQDFCISATAPLHDFDITLIPINAARPGFDANYKLVYKNTGNATDSGTIILSFQDSVLDFVSSSELPNSNAGDNLTWSFANLLPFETRTINVTFNLNGPMETPALNGGEVLQFSASIAETGVSQPFPNHHVLNQTIVNSFDPNDKICLEGQNLGTDFIGNYVSYKIRFENTGTYAAENVVVKDLIDLSKFDIATLTPILGSHQFFTRIAGNQVEFIFEDINLPFDDANNDGYVIFKIKLLPSVIENIPFSNQASIYFDYNFPVVTNTATSVIGSLGLADFDSSQFSLFPVPARDILQVSSSDYVEIKSLEIYNNLGQIVQMELGNKHSINVSQLSKGSYYLRIHTDTSTSAKQFIKD